MQATAAVTMLLAARARRSEPLWLSEGATRSTACSLKASTGFG